VETFEKVTYWTIQVGWTFIYQRLPPSSSVVELAGDSTTGTVTPQTQNCLHINVQKF